MYIIRRTLDSLTFEVTKRDIPDGIVISVTLTDSKQNTTNSIKLNDEQFAEFLDLLNTFSKLGDFRPARLRRPYRPQEDESTLITDFF